MNRIKLLGVALIAVFVGHGIAYCLDTDARFLDNGSGYKQFACIGSAATSISVDCDNGYLGITDAAPTKALSIGTSGAAMTVSATTNRTALGSASAASTLGIKANPGDTYVLHVASTARIMDVTAAGVVEAVGELRVATNTVTVLSASLLGQYATLPTSAGSYKEGSIAYQTSDHKLYISTRAAAGVTAGANETDWVALH